MQERQIKDVVCWYLFIDTNAPQISAHLRENICDASVLSCYKLTNKIKFSNNKTSYSSIL